MSFSTLLVERPDVRPSHTLDDAATVTSMLKVAREYLGMDVAFVSRFGAKERTFVAVDAVGRRCPVEVGGSDPLEDSYCYYVAAGMMPEYVEDARRDPVAADLPVTEQLGIGTHLSVPVVLSDGTVYGTFCCFSIGVEPDMSDRALTIVKILADLVAHQIEDEQTIRGHRADRRRRFDGLQYGHGLELLRQPIVDLTSGDAVGFEVLSRFPTLGGGPAEVYAEAWRLGVGQDLEVKAVEAAMGHLAHLPESAYLAVNVSPQTVTDRDLVALVEAAGAGERLVLEITEHSAVRDYEQLLPALEALGALGVRLAVDDVGTGFSGLDHILRLRPSILKLDGNLVHGIGDSVAKQALLTGLVTYATRTGARLVAEKVETAEEEAALRVLGVHTAQGNHLGRPGRFSNRPDPATSQLAALA